MYNGYILFDGFSVWTGTLSGDLTLVRLAMSNAAGGSNRYSCDFAWDNFDLNDNSNGDGTGTPLYIGI